MRDVDVIEIVRPMTQTALRGEIKRRRDERQAEVEQLEGQLETQRDLEQPPDPAWERRLEVLQSVNGTQDAEDILAENTIKIAVHSVTRREAYQRGNLMAAAREWLAAKMNVADYEDIDPAQISDEIGEPWTAMYQAADIVVALVPEQCSGWDIPEDQEDWADVPDWIFTKLLAATWAMNPQFTLASELGEV